MNFIDRLDGVTFLDASLSLPLDQPFTAATAKAEAGLDHRRLRRLVDAGLLHHPIRSVYVAAQVPDSVALRCACLKLVVPPDAVVVDRHAGWLHGADMVLAPGEHLQLQPTAVFRPSGRGRVRNQLSTSGERNLLPRDITEVDGLRVSTPIRTAWDLGRVRWIEVALPAIDQMLRLDAFDKAELLAGVARFNKMRWVTTLRLAAPLADGRAESPPESVLRLRWIQAHLPDPIPQREVWAGDDFLGRLDLANDELRFGAEYDGAEWHSSSDQIEHDRVRRERIRDLGGYHVIALTRRDLFGQHADAESRLRAGAAEARRRFGIRLPA